MAKRLRDQESEERVIKKAVLSKADLIENIQKDIDEVSMDSEDDDEDDISDDEVTEGEIIRQPVKGNKSAISAQDVQIARETAELFKSNIFKLQIDELIKEVRLKDTKVAKIEKFLHKLYDLVQGIPEFKDKSLEQVENYFRRTKASAPFNDPKPTNVNYKFGFTKPENVSIVGSFGLKTGIQSSRGLSIDVNLTMPADLFQPKDFMNYRALHKRAFYLGYITENLRSIFQKEGLDFLKLTYTYLNGDVLTPVLKIEATNDQLDSEFNFYKTKFAIKILVGFPFGIFDSKKLLPMKNCIRVQKDEELDLPPTPLYNASILSMTTYDHYLKFLYKTKKSTEQFKESCILGRIWLSQRGLGATLEAGGFGHFEFAALTAALLNGGGEQGNKILLSGFSSYQIFKGVIKYLAQEDLCADGYLQLYSDASEVSRYHKGGFNVPTLFDKTTKINILHKMSQSSYQLLVKHAKRTLRLLNDVVHDRFDVLFLKNSNVDFLKYDYAVKFQVSPNDDDTFGPFEKITNLTYENYLSNKISNILRYGLGDRLEGFNVSFGRSHDFDISKRKAAVPAQLTVKIGLLINAQEAERLVIKGPSESEDSSKFRSFWGAKSSLRRFKDGAILHSVIWSTDYKEPIVLSMMKFLFQRHIKDDLKLESEIVDFNKLLPLPNLPSSSKQAVTSTVAFNAIHKSFDELSSVIHKLELPLHIKNILAISPSLRSTSKLQPVPFAVSSKDFYNDIVIQFETSVKWPDELSALEKVKTAFLLKMHEIMQKETAYQTFLVKDEDAVPYNFDITTLNILTPEGFGYRFRILTERDEVLYLRAVENATKEKRQMLETIYMKFNQKYMGSLTHQRILGTFTKSMPVYSATVRLFKKWLDDQLLLCHFPEELVEMLALQPFVDSAQCDAPASVESGFIRVLYFLSQWNWREEPLIMDLNKRGDDEADIVDESDRMSVQKYQMLKSNFDALRKQDPQGMKTQFFVASKIEESGVLWSHGIPMPIAARLTALSKVGIQLISKEGVNTNTLGLLFTPSLGDYDFVIKVKTQQSMISAGVLPEGSSTFKNLLIDAQSYPTDLNAKFDPVQKLVRELQHKFEGTVIFSHHTQTLSENGTNVITGLVVPGKRDKVGKFKVQVGCNVKLEGKEDVVLNKEAMFTEMLNYAGDLVVGFESKL